MATGAVLKSNKCAVDSGGTLRRGDGSTSYNFTAEVIKTLLEEDLIVSVGAPALADIKQLSSRQSHN